MRPATRGRAAARPLRVAFFSLLPDNNIATRLWCVRPAERLATAGIAGRVFTPSSSRLQHAFYRGKSRGWRLRASVYWYAVVLPRRVVQIARAARDDVVFIQRGLFRWSSPPLLERLLRMVARGSIVYHLDDALWAIGGRDRYRTRCALADRVVTGSDTVVDFAREAGASVSVLEYGVDVERYTPRAHADRDPIVIGYSASAPEDFLWLVEAALERVCARTGARVRIVGGPRRPPAPRLDSHLDWEPWQPEREYSLFDDFDVGIAPIDDSELNRGKETIKLKEYMAAGLPIVATPVGHTLRLVENGVNGLLADGEDEWVEAVERLVRDCELRAQMGSAGRRMVEERYDYAHQLEGLAAVLSSVAEARS